MNERIRDLRKILGMNQTEFGNKIGLSQRAIASIEQGSNITERNFNAICKAFSVNPQWLRDGEGEMFVETREALIESVAEEFDLTSDETELIRTFLKLEPKYRTGVLEFVRRLSGNFTQQTLPVSRKPDSEMTREEMHAELDAELDARDAAEKREILTSSAFTGTSGTSSKKINNGS